MGAKAGRALLSVMRCVKSDNKNKTNHQSRAFACRKVRRKGCFAAVQYMGNLPFRPVRFHQLHRIAPPAVRRAGQFSLGKETLDSLPPYSKPTLRICSPFCSVPKQSTGSPCGVLPLRILNGSVGQRQTRAIANFPVFLLLKSLVFPVSKNVGRRQKARARRSIGLTA